jgi:hypothetical protein
MGMTPAATVHEKKNRSQVRMDHPLDGPRRSLCPPISWAARLFRPIRGPGCSLRPRSATLVANWADRATPTSGARGSSSPPSADDQRASWAFPETRDRLHDAGGLCSMRERRLRGRATLPIRASLRQGRPLSRGTEAFDPDPCREGSGPILEALNNRCHGSWNAYRDHHEPRRWEEGYPPEAGGKPVHGRPRNPRGRGFRESTTR